MSPAEGVQKQLQHYYGLGDVPNVADFVVVRDQREQLLVAQMQGEVGVSVGLPRAATGRLGPMGLDTLCQLIEGVSHFVLIAERARRELPTTQLELELQAELDKFVILSGEAGRAPGGLVSHALLRRRLFEQARFVHPAGTERGDRYRLAHRLACRIVMMLQRRYISRRASASMRMALRDFYRLGQAGKLSYAGAA